MKGAGCGCVLLALLAFAAVTPHTALACQADPFALFRDDFSRSNAELGPDGDHLYFADGQLALKPDLNNGWRLPIPRFKLLGASYCAEFKSPTGPADTSAGIMFWMVDAANLFTAMISPDGTFHVSRKKDNTWQTLLTRASPKFKIGPGAVNEIKVITKKLVEVFGAASRYSLSDNSVFAVYLNGQFVTDMDVLAPKDGGFFGLFAESGGSQRSEWRVLNFSATALPLEPSGIYKVSGSVGGSGYEGKVTVDEAGDAYAVVWSINGKSMKGTGVLRGATFAVAYENAGKVELATYAPSGIDWSGKRTNSETGGQVVAETWLRQPR